MEEEDDNYWYYYYKRIKIQKLYPDPEDHREELYRCLNCNKNKWYGNNENDFTHSCECIKIVSICSQYCNLLKENSLNWPSYMCKNDINYSQLIFSEYSSDEIIDIGIELMLRREVNVDKKIIYKIETKNDKIIKCTCKGFKFYNKCKHIKIIQEMINIRLNRRQLGISLALKYFNEKDL